MARLPGFIFGFLIAVLISPTTVVAAEMPQLKWKGDLRYRTVQQKEGTTDSRLYQQIRARLGLKVEIDSDFSMNLRWATASSAISGNQLLGDKSDPGMSRRTFGLDHAFGTWTAPETSNIPLKVSFGRVPNPFFAPGGVQLLFDSDLAFEGLALQWKTSAKDPNAFINLGGFIISENYDAPVDTVDTGVVGVQGGKIWNADGAGKFTLHVARHHFLNVAGRPITSLDRSARIDSLSAPSDRYRGNTVYAEDPLAASKTYLMSSEYVLTNVGFEWSPSFGTDAAEESFSLTVFGDWVQNDFGGHHRDAAEAGFIISRDAIEVLVAGVFKNSDSLLGAFTDSDLLGGGTDTHGGKLGLSYRVTEHAEVALTSYVGLRGAATTERDYNAHLLDFSLRF